MSFRDDQDAMLARLDALDARVAGHDRELAVRDEALAAARSRIAELEAELQDLRRALGDSESTLRDLRVRRGMPVPPADPPFAPGSAPAMVEAERFLAEGIARHNAGDRREATQLFVRGLALVPDHPGLLRAMRRYT